MTFAFTAAGTREQVVQQVDAALARHAEYNSATAEIDAVAAVVKHYLAVGTFAGGLIVETNGHLDTWGGGLQLSIKPLNILQPTTPAAPAEPTAEAAPEPTPAS